MEDTTGGGGGGGGAEETVVVAICLSGGKKSKYILKWAFDIFLPPEASNISFRLFHVYPKIHMVPTPASHAVGGWLPIVHAQEEITSDYRQEVEGKKKKILLPYLEALQSKKVKSEIVMLESDDVATAISAEVAKHSITHLVVGFSSNNIFSRKNLSWKKLMGWNLSAMITESAPSFCSVYVIYDGKLQQMRPADSKPNAVNVVDDISGLSNMSTDSSSSSSLTAGCLLKSGPPSPRRTYTRAHIESAASENTASATQHKEPKVTTSFTSGCSSGINQSSISYESWVSEHTSPGSSFVGTTPGLSPLGSFLDTTSTSVVSFVRTVPIGSSTRTMSKDSFVDTPLATQPDVTFTETLAVSFVDAPPSSYVTTPPKHHKVTLVGTSPKATSIGTPVVSFVDTPQASSFVNAPPKHHTPTSTSPGQASELHKLRTELRYLEQMYKLAGNTDINEKLLFPLDELANLSKQRIEEAVTLKELRAKDLASLQQSKPKVKQIGAREHDQRKSHQSKADTKAANEAKENEDKLKQLIAGSQYQKFTWKEIVEATSSFSEKFKIGMGAFGTVYKCKLYRTAVAVKVLRYKDSATNKQFLQELEILSTIRHPNLLLLLGAVPEESCLVYEYMDNGSLDDMLFTNNDTSPLPWYDRFRVCCEVAAALAFLHSTKPRPIIHRDLKPANILLDHNLVSKIGDAGLGTMLNVEPTDMSLKTQYKETNLVGTLCYIDPEYQRTGRVSTKSDVYALGVVILQLLTAKSASGIAYVIEEAIDEGILKEVLDPKAGEWPAKETLEMALIGLQCAELRGRDRPDLTEKVLPALERLKEIADTARESASRAQTALPSHFICPILKDVMKNPYVAADGYTYERRAIEEWLAINNTSPTTNLPLPHKFIMPNTSLLEAIKQWRSK